MDKRVFKTFLKSKCILDEDYKLLNELENIVQNKVLLEYEVAGLDNKIKYFKGVIDKTEKVKYETELIDN